MPIKKIIILSTGWILVITGPIVGILPGPGGIAVIGVGVVLIMGQSRVARRVFVRTQHRYPEMMGPVRRFIRRRNQKRAEKRAKRDGQMAEDQMSNQGPKSV